MGFALDLFVPGAGVFLTFLAACASLAAAAAECNHTSMQAPTPAEPAQHLHNAGCKTGTPEKPTPLAANPNIVTRCIDCLPGLLASRVPSRPRVPALRVCFHPPSSAPVSCGHDQVFVLCESAPAEPYPSATGNNVSRQRRAGVTNNSQAGRPVIATKPPGDVGHRASEAPGLGHWPCLSLSTAFIQTIPISYFS